MGGTTSQEQSHHTSKSRAHAVDKSKTLSSKPSKQKQPNTTPKLKKSTPCGKCKKCKEKKQLSINNSNNSNSRTRRDMMAQELVQSSVPLVHTNSTETIVVTDTNDK